MPALSPPPRSFSEREPPPCSMAAAEHRPSRIAAGAVDRRQETLPSSTVAEPSPRRTLAASKLLVLSSVRTLRQAPQRALKVYSHVFSALRTLRALSVRSCASAQVSTPFLSWPHALFRKTTGDRGGVSLTAKISSSRAGSRSLDMIGIQNFKERFQNSCCA